ncbi:hypothetical protein CEP52_004254 [Fusarium oligoseptatum]|uniref:Uncharacterized protein n=1 Tax=Fusarium oligoseptatum TaxID=2604345 RepID=A0A428U4F4_9HYPO|nr:hypothetical protein CEP52_004254 [Fusarium oligoseptatum]
MRDRRGNSATGDGDLRQPGPRKCEMPLVALDMLTFVNDWPEAVAFYVASTDSPVSAETFFSISDTQVIELIGEGFPEELARLARAYSIRDQAFTVPTTPSPSRILYQAEYDEVNRTIVAVLALRWIYNNDYASFVRAQPEATRLTRSSFDWVRGRLADALSEPTDLHTLITLVLINDLGKDAQMTMDYMGCRGEDISALNHDTILLRAAEAGMVPCLGKISPRQLKQIMRSLEMGSEFNFGQFAQAENAPVCITRLQQADTDQHVFDLHFAEQLLDISGAAGHMDWTCAKKSIEPILDAYRNVYDVALQVVAGQLKPQAAQDVILVRRARILQAKGFRQLSTENPNERALMRLLCLGGVVDLETAELYGQVWDDLVSHDKTGSTASLIHTLNLSGSEVEPAVQPTYIPALLAQALSGEGPGGGRPKTRVERRMALESALRYLDRVMTVEPRGWKGGLSGRATVVERNVLDVIKGVVQGRHFRDDPSVLDAVDVPDAVVVLSGEEGCGTDGSARAG